MGHAKWVLGQSQINVRPPYRIISGVGRWDFFAVEELQDGRVGRPKSPGCRYTRADQFFLLDDYSQLTACAFLECSWC
jgi:hypothetical protein